MALSPNVVVVNPGELVTAAHLNNIRSNLVNFDALLARLQADAGWTVLTNPTGFTGTIAYRTVGAQVYVIVNLQRSGGNFAETDVTLGTLPAGRRPTTSPATASYVSSPRAVGRVYVTTTGEIHADPLGMNTGGLLAASITFPIALP